MTALEAPSPSGGYRNNPTSAPLPGGSLSPLPPDGNWSQILTVDLGQLRSAVRAFQDTAGDARFCASGLDGALGAASLGDHPWGEDPLGQTFEGQYLPLAQTTQQAVDALSGVFDSIAERLQSATKHFADTEYEAEHLVAGTWGTGG